MSGGSSDGNLTANQTEGFAVSSDQANMPSLDHTRPLFTSGYERFVAKQREADRPDRVKRDEVLVLEFLNSLGLDITVDYEPNINGKKPDFLVSSPQFGGVLIEVETFTRLDEFLADRPEGVVFSVPPAQDPTLVNSYGELPAAERTWADEVRDLIEDARVQFGGQTDYPTLVVVGAGSMLFHFSIDVLAAALRGYWLDTDSGGEVHIDHHLRLKGYEATGLYNSRDHDGQLRNMDLSGAAVLAPPNHSGEYRFWSLFNGAAERPLPEVFADAMIALRSNIVPISGGLMVTVDMDE